MSPGKEGHPHKGPTPKAGQLLLLSTRSSLMVAVCTLLQNSIFSLVRVQNEMQRRHQDLGALKSMAKESLM